MRYRNSKFWNSNSKILTLQTSEFKKYFPTGIFGIKNGIGIPLTMGVPEIGTKNWNSQPITKASECKEKHDKNMAKAYIIIHNQFSPNLKNDLEASDLFPSIRQNQDVIMLLRLIQGLCCSYNAKNTECHGDRCVA
jgi:hypothetical protein